MINVIARLENILDVILDVPPEHEDPARPGVKVTIPVATPDSVRLTRLGVYVNTLIFDLQIEAAEMERARQVQVQQAT